MSNGRSMSGPSSSARTLSPSSAASENLLTPSSSMLGTEDAGSDDGSDAGQNDEDDEEVDNGTADHTVTVKKKKKKKKKSKKKKSTPAEVNGALINNSQSFLLPRYKNWRHVSSYSGSWLQLPIELLQSIMLLNADPGMISNGSRPGSKALRDALLGKRGSGRGGVSGTGADELEKFVASVMTAFREGKLSPPPVDPGVVWSVVKIRRLVDDASDLAVRAASGITSYSKLSSHPSLSISAQLGLSPASSSTAEVESTREHRLRVLAVQRIAQAFEADEIGAACMCMQASTAVETVADEVLKVEEGNGDARYVQFFFHKIPSTQMSQFTMTAPLDSLVTDFPDTLPYRRTRGSIRCYKLDFVGGIKDYTHVLSACLAQRKARRREENKEKEMVDPPNGKGKASSGPLEGESTAPPTTPFFDGAKDGVTNGTTWREMPTPLELQTLFLRGSAYFNHAMWLIEGICYDLEGIPKDPLYCVRLFNAPGCKYGGVEENNPAGPLGSRTGAKFLAYKQALLGDPKVKEKVETLLRKSMKDLVKWLEFFAVVRSETPLRILKEGFAHDDLTTSTGPTDFRCTCCGSIEEPSKSESKKPIRPPCPAPTHSSAPPTSPPSATPKHWVTFHPLLTESYYLLLLTHLLLGDYLTCHTQYLTILGYMATQDGYPIFTLGRSAAQDEFMEILGRLDRGWELGRMERSEVPTMSTSGETGEVGEPKSQLEALRRMIQITKIIVERETAEDAARSAASAKAASSPSTTTSSTSQPPSAANYPPFPPPLQGKGKSASKPTTRPKYPTPTSGRVVDRLPMHGARMELGLAWMGVGGLEDLAIAAEGEGRGRCEADGSRGWWGGREE